MASDKGETADKEWTRAEIEENIEKYDKWAVKAIIAIYNLQTESEKRSRSANRLNGVGFSKADADFLSSLAQSALTSINEYGSPIASALTDSQLKHGREAIQKYSAQLALIANGELEKYIQ